MKRLLALVLLLVVALTASAQAKNQWEYLIVTGGKVTFSGFDYTQPDQDALKVARYGEASLYLFQEAVSIESQLDTFGKAGWELVSVVGMIGGDQEMIFKRALSSPTTAAELKAAKKTVDSVTKRLANLESDIAAFKKLKFSDAVAAAVGVDPKKSGDSYESDVLMALFQPFDPDVSVDSVVESSRYTVQFKKGEIELSETVKALLDQLKSKFKGTLSDSFYLDVTFGDNGSLSVGFLF